MSAKNGRKMSNFLPSDHERQELGGYMKLKPGDNRIRILSSAIVGREWWLDADGNIVPRNNMAGEGGKPVRRRMNEQLTADEFEASKYFWAFVVWNRDSEKVQILEIKQISIQNAMEDYLDDEEWGDPKDTKDSPGYDFVIKKSGEGKNTRYSVINKPRKAIENDILAEYNSANINLEALYEGEDPFSYDEEVTPEEVEEALK
jgi:hypothetical protein